MYVGLYYPHTEVRSVGVMKSALLMWDHLETIVPWSGYKPEYAKKGHARAMELVGRPRSPTVADQNKFHEMVEEMLQDGVPEVFKYAPRNHEPSARYDIWPQKLATKTWGLLAEAGLTSGYSEANGDYALSHACGLTVMSLLADVMAGKTRSRITDRQLAYATLANVSKINSATPPTDFVYPITFDAISWDDLSLKSLVEFREREAKDSTKDYQKLRHNYVDLIETHVKTLSDPTLSVADKTQLNEEFKDKVDLDLSDLKRELGFAKRDAWFSREVVRPLRILSTARAVRRRRCPATTLAIH